MSDVSTNAVPLPELARRAAAVAKNSHLQAINLRSLHVDLLQEPTAEPQGVTLTTQHRTEHSVSPETEEQPAHLRVRVHFGLTVQDSRGTQDLLRLEAVYDAEYALNRSMPPDVAETFPAFAATNGVVHVWPYLRELVQTTTWRMGLPPFPLPLFRVTDAPAPGTPSAPAPTPR